MESEQFYLLLNFMLLDDLENQKMLESGGGGILVIETGSS